MSLTEIGDYQCLVNAIYNNLFKLIAISINLFHSVDVSINFFQLIAISINLFQLVSQLIAFQCIGLSM